MARWSVVAALLLLAPSCGGGASLKADAGDDFVVSVGSSPMFDGCSSSGDVSNYSWVILEAPLTMESDAGKSIRGVSPECSFELESAMLIDEVGVWTIELTVTNGDGSSSTDTVTVEVTP